MDERRCGWCGSDVSHMQRRALYCCIQHKKNAASKRHRERNPGYYAQYSRSASRVAYVENNRELLRAKARAYQRRTRAADPVAALAKQRAWWAANADKHRLYQANRRAQKRAGGYVVTDRDIRRLLLQYRHSCAYCAAIGVPLHLDHVIPLKLGGKHSIGNLVPACQACNQGKSAGIAYRWKVRRWLMITFESALWSSHGRDAGSRYVLQ